MTYVDESNCQICLSTDCPIVKIRHQHIGFMFFPHAMIVGRPLGFGARPCVRLFVLQTNDNSWFCLPALVFFITFVDEFNIQH